MWNLGTLSIWRTKPNQMRVFYDEPCLNLFQLFNYFFFFFYKAEERNKFVLTGWMNKTLRKKRAKINKFKKTTWVKIKGHCCQNKVRSKIWFDRSILRILTKNKEIITKFEYVWFAVTESNWFNWVRFSFAKSLQVSSYYI